MKSKKQEIMVVSQNTDKHLFQRELTQVKESFKKIGYFNIKRWMQLKSDKE